MSDDELRHAAGRPSLAGDDSALDAAHLEPDALLRRAAFAEARLSAAVMVFRDIAAGSSCKWAAATARKAIHDLTSLP